MERDPLENQTSLIAQDQKGAVPKGYRRISQSQTLNGKAFKTTAKVGLKASLLLELLSKVGAEKS
ncbi:hypothetical protein [Paenibacillus amylolyticus]|uniref:hypothetical protein n=1 Tax=Paenibacillus amylolyticus TaxID=1451 RepID=UPI003EB6BCED